MALYGKISERRGYRRSALPLPAKQCVECGREYVPGSNRAKRCPGCRVIVSRNRLWENVNEDRKQQNQEVIERYGSKCYHCDGDTDRVCRLNLDGEWEWDNLVLMHKKCQKALNDERKAEEKGESNRTT